MERVHRRPANLVLDLGISFAGDVATAYAPSWKTLRDAT
jgi:hypothetical protein